MGESAETLHGITSDNVDALGPDGEDGPFVLTGAVLIAEWMDRDGREWFTYVSTEARGEVMPPWRIRGLCDEVLTALTAGRVKRMMAEVDEDDD